MSVLSVTGLNNYISFKIKGDIKLKSIMVEGEISNFTCHYKTGHLYFTLKDSSSTIKVVMFSSSALRLKFSPSNGMRVIVSGSIDVYLRDGVYQINATDMYPSGIGQLYLQYEKLKNELANKGLFDEKHKKAIPKYPQNIGIVTSSNAAALADILKILDRRYSIANVTLYPSTVQGENSAESLCKGLYDADNDDNDVIILTRGGGSFEDLFSFSSEELARTIFECNTPIVSAVGHETDFTIADFVADLRAPTPSAAAELVTPDILEIDSYLKQYPCMISNIISTKFDRYDLIIKSINGKIISNSPKAKILSSISQINFLIKQMKISMEKILYKNDSKLSENISLLNSLSPLNVLARGYSITYKNNEIVDKIEMLNKGDKIKIKLSNGDVNAQVEGMVK